MISFDCNSKLNLTEKERVEPLPTTLVAVAQPFLV